jgi:hypothetical protein
MSTNFFADTMNEGKAAPSFGFLYDSGILYTIQNINYTGGWRPAKPSDFAANISVSGLNLTVGAVAVTGNPNFTVSNPILAVSGNMVFDLAPVVSAQSSGNATLTQIQAILNSGTYGFFATGVTGSQFQIPAGAKSYSIGVESGSAFINGTLFNSISSIGGGGYDKFTLSAVINVGTTGGRVIATWEV